MAKYIYQYQSWPEFTWDAAAANVLLATVHKLRGEIAGQVKFLGFNAQQDTQLNTLTQEVIKTSEIESENLNFEQVRSSIAKRLGINIGGLTVPNRNVEGIVDIIMDATQNFNKKLTNKRLYDWHAALFPTGRSGMYNIEVAKYRTGEMQIVSGALGKEKLHYEAIAASEIVNEMKVFLNWVNEKQPTLDPILKASIAHFWFIIIHPFDDGNGRLARAISEMLLAKADNSAARFYSMSSRILVERKQYYAILQKVQHADSDITDWLSWYLKCLIVALQNTLEMLGKVVQKASFWNSHERTDLNARQRLMINKLFDGFDGKLKSSKWAKITKCSADTALRDIKDLIEKGILKQEDAGGRSTNYELKL